MLGFCMFSNPAQMEWFEDLIRKEEQQDQEDNMFRLFFSGVSKLGSCASRLLRRLIVLHLGATDVSGLSCKMPVSNLSAGPLD